MIETRELTKMYGELYALERLTLKLERGDVYGFIGPNGAGKTTTMRILATLLNPTWGEATVCGFSIYNGAKDIRRLMGYMPDFFGVYDDMKVIEYLEFFAAAYRIQGPERRKKCDQVLDLVDLGYKRDALVTSLSRGMTQRLGLARVLLHEPQVLLLDEPASGLDPRARIEMRGLIKELRNMGKTILVSSHILPELADICNKIGIIERGKLIFDGDVDKAIKQVRQRHILKVAVVGDMNLRAKEILEINKDVDTVEHKVDEGVLIVTLKEGITDGAFIADSIMQKGLKLKTLKEEEINQRRVKQVAVVGDMNSRAMEILKKHNDVDSIEPKPEEELLIVTLKDGVSDGTFIADLVIQNGLKLRTLKEEEINLEDVFMRITKGITN
jgi:ABC-2 type transport system ATP-binding protein